MALAALRGAKVGRVPVQRLADRVAIISPWNFPLAIFVGQVAAALAAGNLYWRSRARA